MKHLLISLFIFHVLSFQIKAQSFATETGYVQFLSDAPLEKFIGKSSHLTGMVNLDSNFVDFYIDLNTLKTGISLRDEHMRENYLETEKFPFAEFTGTFTPSISKAVTDTQNVVVKGSFTIHGIKQPMEVSGKVVYDGKKLHIRTKFNVKLSDHNIDIPNVVYRKLDENQEVFLKADLKKEK